MTRRRLSVALVVVVLLGTSWADAAAQRTAADVAAEKRDDLAEEVGGIVKRHEIAPDGMDRYLVGKGMKAAHGYGDVVAADLGMAAHVRIVGRQLLVIIGVQGFGREQIGERLIADVSRRDSIKNTLHKTFHP